MKKNVRTGGHGILKHGSIPVAAIKDPATREAVMKLNENILALASVVENKLRENVTRRKKEA